MTKCSRPLPRVNRSRPGNPHSTLRFAKAHRIVSGMGTYSESPGDRLLKEYSIVFQEFDDLTLARWMCQTLGQLGGRSWRLSHPLLGAYRLAAQVAFDRQIWFKRLATQPPSYTEAECCRAPLLPLFTRDVTETGLSCIHCNETAVAFDDLPAGTQNKIKDWADRYAPVHRVAHWDDAERKRAGNYDGKFEDAALQAERLLAEAVRDIIPLLVESYPALVWEDQDECLEVRPEDINLTLQ